jgi:putative peptidoglycan lipid II flippase
MAEFEAVYLSSLGLQFFITLPALVGLVVMAQPLVELLFQRGQFGPLSTRATTEALWGYVIGLPFLSGTSLTARAFFSLSDTKTPAKIAAVSLVLGLLMAFGLMWPLKHSGLALASSLASLINFIWLNRTLGQRQGYNYRPLFREISLYTLWALLMGVFLWPLYNLEFFKNLSPLISVITGLILGPIFYFSLAAIFKCPHLKPLGQIWHRIRTGGSRK